jgi:DNA-binding IclR family transcriptional regulator
VEQEKLTGNYRIGMTSFSLAQKLVNASSVINLTHPLIELLAKKHGEDVYMTVIKDGDVLFLDMASCNQQIRAASLIGRTFPCFTNAAGKVMKALESTEVIEWLNSKKNKAHKHQGSLASELLEIRSNGGIAVDTGGLGDGVISVAVAVKDYAGHVIGAITMLGPSFRFLKERIENEIIPSLVEAAALASEKFGYMPA